MEIILAKNIAFCFGVRKAYEKTLQALKNNKGPCQMLGQLVHNEDVVEKLSNMGLTVTSSPEKAKEGTVVIRTHGETEKTYNILRERGIEIIDATCPLVKKVQNAAINFQERGRKVIIIGDKNHDEVIGIQGSLNHPALVLSNKRDLTQDVKRKLKGKPIGVVIQTTQNMEEVEDFVDHLKKEFDHLEYTNTLCPAVLERQKEVKNISKQVDVLLVVGSKSSSNTQKLVEIAKRENKKVFNPKNKEDLQESWLEGEERVGITSGTSTPDWIIEEIIAKISYL